MKMGKTPYHYRDLNCKQANLSNSKVQLSAFEANQSESLQVYNCPIAL